MKTFFRKHKILVIALCSVLCLGILSGLVIGGVIRFSTRGTSFETVADAVEKQNAELLSAANEDGKPVSGKMPTPTPEANDAKLSAEEVKRLSEEVQRRRRPVIPVRSDVWVADNSMLWKETDPDAVEKEAAQMAAENLTQILFGKTYVELTGSEAATANVRLFTDPAGDRDAFLRITDPQGVYILSIRAGDQSLICADLLTYPEAPSTDREKECIAIAEKLGYHAVHYRHDTNGQHEIVYEFKTDTDVCLTFSYVYDKLWQVAVHPSQQAMEECEYFLADIQLDYSKPAYPKNFVEAKAPDLDGSKMVDAMTVETKLAKLVWELSGEQLNSSNIKWTFYRDESGAREDCWELTGDGFEIVVSAYSRDVISFTGTIPCKNLLSIPYEKMGEEEYEAETKKIADYFITSLGDYDNSFHGKNVTEISVNAVYDYHCCTMDIVLEDGTWYECYFYDGVLKEIWHFADERLFMDSPAGWVADAVYIHSVTGKPYIPEYRDWDGNLHVTQRPEA